MFLVNLPGTVHLNVSAGPLGVPSPIRRAGSSWSMSPPPLSPLLPPFHPPSLLHTMPNQMYSKWLKQVKELGHVRFFGFTLTPHHSVQKMEAGIVVAINDMKVALLGKLHAFARPS